jgi:ABC-2 type transport system ATP-binding protein
MSPRREAARAGRARTARASGPPRPSRLVVSGLEQRYGRRVALRGVSCELTDGVTGLLGPNGAGKSSLMKCIAGVQRWHRGRIVVDGIDAGQHPTLVRARVGYVPERAGFLSEMRVDQLLRFATEAKGIPRARRTAEIDRVLADTGLESSRGRVSGNLSKGYRQRLGLAQALLGEPALLVLDEPTSGLDPNSLTHLYEFIANYGRSHAVLMSTHVLADVRAVCDRVVVLTQGIVVADGPTAELAHADGTTRLRFRVSGRPAAEFDPLVAQSGATVVSTLSANGRCEAIVDTTGEGAVGRLTRSFVEGGWDVVGVEPVADGLGLLFEEAQARQEVATGEPER